LNASRSTAVAIALLLAALAAAGCGLGPGKGLGDVGLTVTRDYGSEPVRDPVADEASEADTVMRVLERNADITTRYGGGFVQSIDGLEGEDSASGPVDWFFYVNGVESTVGAADYPLHGGEAIWWDYRNWGAAMRVPAVVGSWPQPLTGGYEGERRPVVVECMGGGPGEDACAVARERLRAAGVEVAAGEPAGAIRVLVGAWAALRGDPAASRIEDGPEVSGVFAEFEREGGSYALEGLGEDGRAARAFGPGAGLVAATRRYDAPPTWVVTGAGAAGTLAAARLLDAADLRDHYAVATEDGVETPLPVR
jgi:Domain of unknown function (DUF4430)